MAIPIWWPSLCGQSNETHSLQFIHLGYSTYAVHHTLECLGSDDDGGDDDFILFYLVQLLNRHVQEIIRQPIQIHTIRRNRTMLVMQLGSVLVFVLFQIVQCVCVRVRLRP